jgi:hypothetical protein
MQEMAIAAEQNTSELWLSRHFMMVVMLRGVAKLGIS